ncbi:MAG TPA: ThiF family adenylyltransferase [Thermoanaerobaculia bacterium]|nr:ThiF family adenylyltransferase [Thermoanaerobaculia bacterium]
MMTRGNRHSRHELFAPIGAEGQAKLASSRIAVVGCGALGSNAAGMLGRAGVGTAGAGLLRLIDRDYVEESNLQRQALFDSEDARHATPKALAAARHLERIDARIRTEAIVRELNASSALALLEGVDLIIDGTDNFRTRFVINDAAVALERPWIYGAAVGSRGAVATILPGTTPCLRCLLEEVPAFGAAESCDTAGIITPLPALVASLQVAAAMKLIVSGEIERGVSTFDCWSGTRSFRNSLADVSRNGSCRSCGTRELPALEEDSEQVVTLCGRNSVQLFSSLKGDLDSVERRFIAMGRVHRSPQSVTAEIEEGCLTLFEDGRVIVEGTTDPLEAKSIVARYLGG